MRADIRQASLNVCDAIRIARRFRFSQQRCALGICGKNGLDQASIFSRGFLGNCSQPSPWGKRNQSSIGSQFPKYQAKQGRFASAVAPDKTKMRAAWDLCRRILKQRFTRN